MACKTIFSGSNPDVASIQKKTGSNRFCLFFAYMPCAQKIKKGGLSDSPFFKSIFKGVLGLKVNVEAQGEQVILRFNIIIDYVVFTVKIFVGEFGGKVRCDFKVDSKNKLSREGRVIFIDVV